MYDLRDPSEAVMAVRNIDWVFNLAANMGGMGYITKYNASIMEDNALININMLKASLKEQIKKFFFSSSACVYNRELQQTPNLPPLAENQAIPAHPDSNYGWEKLFSELLCKSYATDYGLKVCIGRLHNVYGPYTTYKGGREKAPAALCRKVAEAKDGDTIEVWGDGEQSRSFLYIDDCLDAIHRLMKKSDYSEPLNIGTSDIISIDDLAKLIINISGKKLDISHNLNMPQGVRGRNADLTLIRNILGWHPKTSLEEGMTVLYRWVEKQVAKT